MAITITGNTGGPLTGSTFIFSGGSTGLTFNGSGITETLVFAGITANGGNVSLSTDAVNSAINIGTGAAVKTVTLGSTFGASTTTIQAPSAGLTILGIQGVVVANKNFVTIDTITGQIGADSGSISNITITGDTGGPITGSNFTFDGGTTGLTFNGAGTTETLQFAGITANGGTVSLATDATTSTVNIGTGAGNKTVTLGSTTGTSTTNLQSGSGGIKIPAFAEGALVTNSTGTIATVTGTAGLVLTANGPGVAPTFQAVPGSGGVGSRVLISSQTASASANISFTSVTGFTYYEVELLGLVPTTNGDSLLMLLSIDGGASYIGGTNYIYFGTNSNSSVNTFSGYNNAGASSYLLAPSVSNSVTGTLNGFVQLFGMPSSKKFTWNIEATNTGGNEQQCLGVGAFVITANAANAVRFQFSSGTIASGVLRLFGIV